MTLLLIDTLLGNASVSAVGGVLECNDFTKLHQQWVPRDEENEPGRRNCSQRDGTTECLMVRRTDQRRVPETGSSFSLDFFDTVERKKKR